MLSIHVDNMTRQVSNYLGSHTPDAAALYIVWGGANDISNDANNASAAVANEVAIIQHLAEAGAKTFLVPNLPPLGDIPKYNTSAATSAAYNEVSLDFKNDLDAALDTLQTTLINEGLTVTIYRLDVYDLFLRLRANPNAYGFQNIMDPAQGAKVADDHLFWDIQHPTTAGHYQLAAEAYTLLSGIPVVEVNPILDNSGFYITRTGTDLSKALKVFYSLGGSAVDGEDYATLPDVKKLRPNKQTVTISVTPTAAAVAGSKVKLKVLPETDYALPVDRKVTIELP